MYPVSYELMDLVVGKLLAAIGEKSYFSGRVEVEYQGVECTLLTSVIVYRQEVSMPEGDFRKVSELVPVWWEFHTVTENGEELNDFDFSQLCSLL